MERGDEIVVSKFSNTLRGTRELAAFIEYCCIKVVRIISIHDGIDTYDELFPETNTFQIMDMFGLIAEECAVLRKANAHIIHLKQNIRPIPKTEKTLSKLEREKNIVNMYDEGYTLDDIFAVSGFISRSSVFRILNKYGVTLNRGLLKRRGKGIVIFDLQYYSNLFAHLHTAKRFGRPASHKAILLLSVIDLVEGRWHYKFSIHSAFG